MSVGESGRAGVMMLFRGEWCEVETVEQTAHRLGYSPRQIRRMLKTGELIGKKVSGCWFVRTRTLFHRKMMVS